MKTLILIAGYLLFPCLYGAMFLTTWFPYHLAGRQFLTWYLIHMAAGHILLGLANHPKIPLAFLGITLLISVSRICQGVYHHKPVLYLCLLTLLNVMLLLLWNRRISHSSRI